MTQLLTIPSTGSAMERFSSTIDPVVSFNTSFKGNCALPNETLTGNSTSSSSPNVFELSNDGGTSAVADAAPSMTQASRRAGSRPTRRFTACPPTEQVVADRRAGQQRLQRVEGVGERTDDEHDGNGPRDDEHD